jgi:hypothetical protein
VTSYSPITFGSTAPNENPLPVEVVGFAGLQNGNSVVLEWITMSEKDNDYFEVERSIDGVNFVAIGRIEGAGDSSDKLSYSFTDNAPEQGCAYYRLVQVDYDGTRTYAEKIISVNYAASSDISLTVSPNPTRGQFRLSVSGAMGGTAKLLSQSGKVLRVFDVTETTQTIDISDLPSGIYILNYLSDDKAVHERVVKL